MNKNTLDIQRIDAGLSSRARFAPVAGFSVDALAPARPAPACGPVESVEFAMTGDHLVNDTTGLDHTNTSWLGGFVGNGCATPAYGTKRITSGSLIEVMT